MEEIGSFIWDEKLVDYVIVIIIIIKSCVC